MLFLLPTPTNPKQIPALFILNELYDPEQESVRNIEIPIVEIMSFSEFPKRIPEEKLASVPAYSFRCENSHYVFAISEEDLNKRKEFQKLLCQLLYENRCWIVARDFTKAENKDIEGLCKKKKYEEIIRDVVKVQQKIKKKRIIGSHEGGTTEENLAQDIALLNIIQEEEPSFKKEEKSSYFTNKKEEKLPENAIWQSVVYFYTK